MHAAPKESIRPSHGRMIRFVGLATLLALVSWLLPPSSVVTILTGIVIPHVQPMKTVLDTVPMIDFNNATKFASLATCSIGMCPVLSNPAGVWSAAQFQYPNPQTVFIAAASSSGGRVQAMTPTYPNSSYRVTFFGPSIQCETANEDVIPDLNRIDESTAPPPGFYSYLGLPSTSYSAFVPARDAKGNLAAFDFTKLPVSWDQLKNASLPTAPELWVKSGRYDWPDRYVCTLYNTSYAVNFTFKKGVQPTDVTTSPLEAVPYVIALPDVSKRFTATGPEYQQFAYQAIWMALVQQLVGRFTNTPFGSNLFQTPVIGSKDFRPWFSHSFGAGNQPFASDLTVPEVIEEMSRNLTLSFFASPDHLATTGVQTNISISGSDDIEHLKRVQVRIEIAVSILWTIACVAVGIFAEKAERSENERATSEVVQAVHDPKIRHESELRESSSTESFTELLVEKDDV